MENKNQDFSKLFNIKKFHTAYLTNLAKENKVGVGCLMFLKALSVKDFHSQQELSEFIGCNKAHTSRIITQMQAKGLVENSQDKNIALTNSGHQLAKKVEKLDKAYISKLLQDIPEEDLEVFRKVCKLIYENSEKLISTL